MAPERRGALGRVPVWTLTLVVLVLAGGAVTWIYRSLDALYPQPLWKYFRPLPSLASGHVLYRDSDGQLFVADAGSTQQPRRLLDVSLPADTHEIVRDAVVLPGTAQVAYFATEKREGQADVDRLKFVALDGGPVRSQTLAAGEPLRQALFTSASGRTLAVTSRDRTRVYFVDVASGTLSPGQADAPPERMLWNRNGDALTALQQGQPAFTTSPNGSLRAQVREGRRRAPECGEATCERAQELSVGPASVAASAQPSVVFAAYRFFSAEGWGPVPAQPAQRIYGRLVWSPDGAQVLFSTLDGADARTYVVGADGRTRPRLLFQNAEALDWVA